MPRPQRVRGKLRFEKPPLSHSALANRLIERGLQLPDRDRAERYLLHIGYYRLSPYMIPFQRDTLNHAFRPGAAFDDVLDLYVFDRSLRLHVMDALERVEVAIRAALTDHMSTAYEDSHWYLDSSHFSDQGRHRNLLSLVQEAAKTRLAGRPEPARISAEPEHGGMVHRSALEHYLLTYGSPELPPSWLVIEMLTLGQLESVIRNLRRRSDRTAIAASIGLNARLLESWLRTYVRVRNICAHHGRLWNVGLGVYPMIPSAPSVSWLRSEAGLPEESLKRLYPVLVSLQTVLNSVSPRSTWAQRLCNLLSTRPSSNLVGMGIPTGWERDEFWARHISV